jgi:hypothetical protein
MPFWPPLLPADEPEFDKTYGRYKYINFIINLLNLTKPFNSGPKKYMHKATRLSGSSSITMVMVFVWSFLLFVQIHYSKVLILPYY